MNDWREKAVAAFQDGRDHYGLLSILRECWTALGAAEGKIANLQKRATDAEREMTRACLEVNGLRERVASAELRAQYARHAEECAGGASVETCRCGFWVIERRGT